jgi:hypothetical protein
LKPPPLAKKSVVRVAHHVLTSPKVHVRPEPVPQGVVAHRARLMPLRLRLKENKHAATSTQEISQRAEGP